MIARGVRHLGKMLIVDTIGCGDYTSISDAVKNYKQGDIIFIKAGVYGEG